MRKVMLLKVTHGAGGRRTGIEDDCEATFIQWGTDAIEHTDGFAQQTIAVCEKADGTVVTPIPTMIRFIADGTCKWKKSKLDKGIIVNPHNFCVSDENQKKCTTCGLQIEVVS